MFKTLPSQTAAQSICALLKRAHERPHFVGGLFNAYEKAVHYELLSELYRSDIWDTALEKSIPNSKGEKCDLVIPLDDGSELWLEAKIIWFAYGQPHYYYTLPKYLDSPQGDWLRLAHLPQMKAHRAVLVILGWDDADGAYTQAMAWRKNTQAWMRSNGGPEARIEKLQSFEFRHPLAKNGVQKFDGEILVWSST